MAAAESPLVPGSQYAGGALIAVDPNGQEAKLGLRKYHIDVHIEDGFARTTIDQTYFNHDRLAAGGHVLLPAAAGRLAVAAGHVRRRQAAWKAAWPSAITPARSTRRIVTSQRDPALLEWVDGSTFKMRVFPLEARQEKRIILSYTQKLPSLYGQTQYRFPAGHSLQAVARLVVPRPRQERRRPSLEQPLASS